MDTAELEQKVISLKQLHMEDWISLIIFWGLAIILFSQFFSRYVFNFPLGWSEEVSRYLLILLAFAGACIASRNQAHIAMTLFHRWLPKNSLGKLHMVIECFNCVVICLLAYFCWQIIPLISPHSLASLPLSLTWVYALLLVFLFAMLARTLRIVLVTPYKHQTQGL
ncbi:TRAP transporter small permease [Catenovulum agarivorans]|uniref:TRAP transporter small permease n=1 Tax=Catenovulum agarivorans TaxID=1172192 RepID=UPI0002E99C58|nr:TRAP transporter small permease [Catenovulum agarivorans]